MNWYRKLKVDGFCSSNDRNGILIFKVWNEIVGMIWQYHLLFPVFNGIICFGSKFVFAIFSGLVLIKYILFLSLNLMDWLEYVDSISILYIITLNLQSWSLSWINHTRIILIVWITSFNSLLNHHLIHIRGNNMIRVCNLRRNGYRMRKREWGIERFFFDSWGIERLRESGLWNCISFIIEETIYIYIYMHKNVPLILAHQVTSEGVKKLAKI